MGPLVLNPNDAIIVLVHYYIIIIVIEILD